MVSNPDHYQQRSLSARDSDLVGNFGGFNLKNVTGGRNDEEFKAPLLEAP